jgi:hypothetical protein
MDEEAEAQQQQAAAIQADVRVYVWRATRVGGW